MKTFRHYFLLIALVFALTSNAAEESKAASAARTVGGASDRMELITANLLERMSGNFLVKSHDIQTPGNIVEGYDEWHKAQEARLAGIYSGLGDERKRTYAFIGVSLIYKGTDGIYRKTKIFAPRVIFRSGLRRKGLKRIPGTELTCTTIDNFGGSGVAIDSIYARFVDGREKAYDKVLTKEPGWIKLRKDAGHEVLFTFFADAEMAALLYLENNAAEIKARLDGEVPAGGKVLCAHLDLVITKDICSTCHLSLMQASYNKREVPETRALYDPQYLGYPLNISITSMNECDSAKTGGSSSRDGLEFDRIPDYGRDDSGINFRLTNTLNRKGK